MHRDFRAMLTLLAPLLSVTGCADGTTPGRSEAGPVVPRAEASLPPASEAGVRRERGVGDSSPPSRDAAAKPSPFCSKLISDTVQRTQGPLAKPAYLASVTDPIFQTKITRVSGDPGTVISGSTKTWGTRSRHAYSKAAAWSVPDSQGKSILFLNWTDKGPIWLDGETYQPLITSAPSWYYDFVDYRWHPALPDVLIGVNKSNGDLRFWNVRTNQATTVYSGSVSSSQPVKMGAGEGNPSVDGKYVALNVGEETSGPPYFFVVDLSACLPSYSAGCGVKRTADITIASVSISSLDWVSVSPLGTYIVVSRSSQETAVLDWDRKTGTVNKTRRAQFASGHFDLAADAKGAEVAINGEGIMFRLSDGSSTTILDTKNHQYHSGTQHLQPSSSAATDFAWGSQEGGTATSQYRGEIIAFGANGSFYRLAHHRTNLTSATDGMQCDYGRCPYATPSPDGKRALFASDWGNPSGPVEAYVLDLRNLCP